MEKILKAASGILVVLLIVSAVYAWLAGQYPVNTLAIGIILAILTAVRVYLNRRRA